MAGDEDDKHARADLEAGLQRMLGEPDDEARREQLTQDDVVLVAVGGELVLLVERRRLELDLLDVLVAHPVRIAVEVVEDPAPPAQIDALEARHPELAEVDGGDREVLAVPGVRLVAVVVADLERVPADAAALRLHPVLAV